MDGTIVEQLAEKQTKMAELSENDGFSNPLNVETQLSIGLYSSVSKSVIDLYRGIEI